MKSYYSIVKYVNNSLTNETISLGLIMAGGGSVFFHLSSTKIELAKRLNAKNYKLLDFSLKHFKNLVEKELTDDKSELFEKKKTVDFDYLLRLSNYNNGILQFSKPEIIDVIVNRDSFSAYLKRFIGEDLSPVPKVIESPFKDLIKSKLIDPLQDQIDVDFTIKKNQLESLFFDFHVDGIGVNGSIYAAKSVDFNSSRQLGQIRTDISEYESIIERLNRFAERKGLSSDNKYFLIIDPYKGNQPSYNDLYSLLEKNNMPLFKILVSAEVEKFANQVIKNKAKKFSQVVG